MNNLREDDKVIDLLSKLKHVNGVYPSPMFAARRRMYLKQMANVGLGIGLGARLRHAVQGGTNGKSATTTTITSKILETALIAAIALEAGTVAYLYRDRIAHAVKSYVNRSAIQQAVIPSDNTKVSTHSETEGTVTPLVTPSATHSATPSGTPSATPSTELVGNDNQNNNGGSNNGVNANATPNPNGNNGNQYGLTPKPERTRENNGSGDSGGGGGGGNNGDGGGNNNP